MKVRTFSLCAILVLGLSFVTYPNYAATVKNGIKCATSGTKVKVGTKIYQCGKNPYVRPKSLTWTLRDCLEAKSLLREAKEQYEVGNNLAQFAGPEAETALKELQLSISNLESSMKNEICKKGL